MADIGRIKIAVKQAKSFSFILLVADPKPVEELIRKVGAGVHTSRGFYNGNCQPHSQWDCDDCTLFRA